MPLTVDCFITLWLAVTDFDTEGHLLVSLLACLSVCLSASLFVCLFACLPIYPSVCCLSIHLPPACTSICLSALPACLLVFPSICRSVRCPSIHLPTWLLFVCPTTCLSVCQLVHLSLCSQLFNHRLEHNLAINRFPYLLSFNCRNQGVCPSSIKFTTVCGQDRSLSYKITCGKHEAMV